MVVFVWQSTKRREIGNGRKALQLGEGPLKVGLC